LRTDQRFAKNLKISFIDFSFVVASNWLLLNVVNYNQGLERLVFVYTKSVVALSAGINLITRVSYLSEALRNYIC
jgi:hypothetical protein